MTRRVDSAISLGSSGFCSSYTTLKPKPNPHGPIILSLEFEDLSCVKLLDCRTFTYWDDMEGLLLDLEKEGTTVGELWDRSEKMRICYGDWDALVRPGQLNKKKCIHAQNST